MPVCLPACTWYGLLRLSVVETEPALRSRVRRCIYNANIPKNTPATAPSAAVGSAAALVLCCGGALWLGVPVALLCAVTLAEGVGVALELRFPDAEVVAPASTK